MEKINSTTFWGIAIPANSSISQVSEKDFKITMACMKPPKEESNERSTLYFKNEDGEELILCTLSTTSVLQQRLNMIFSMGDVASFRVDGPHEIHLSGYVLNFPQGEDEEDSEDDEDYDVTSDLKRLQALENGSADIDDSDADISDDDDEENEDDDDDESLAEEEMDGGPIITELDDDDEDDEEEDDEVDDEDEQEEEDDDEEEKEEQKKLNNKDSKNTNKKRKMNEQSKELQNILKKKIKLENGKSPKKSVKKGNIVVVDEKEGNGPIAGKGKHVSVYYTGKLAKNGKVFDKCLSGKPFMFHLGANEVIKGWDIGVEGMKVGGKRTLTIPAKMAYGNDSNPGIPPNSTLIFDIELKGVKK